MNISNTQNLPGKKGIAIVTGASAGLGAVYADRLAGRGYDLILVARRADRLEAMSQRLRTKHGIEVKILVANLTERKDLERIITEISANPNITLLVNNAGNATLAPAPSLNDEQIDAMHKLNVDALVGLSQVALRKFLERDSGTIINVGSVLSFQTIGLSAVYSGTKGYVLNFTRGLQIAAEGTNVKVQLVLPASTATELWDLSGVPLANLNQSSVMTAEHCVDAALAGLDQGEAVTLPSVENKQLWDAFEAARTNLFAATQTGKPASRYAVESA
ncbi:SDR family NAD(P)-dependent oxidoreductase [Undibacterium sp. TJN25]|uniref:SDR family NAD(P)-dependent oxidoreductase n=1 Tax=Undibacterium sp. TJN25 TaxID=3413056 RepID=UPI003BEFA510